MKNYKDQLLGQILLDRNSVSEEELQSVLRRQNKDNFEKIGSILVRLGLISEQTLLETLSIQLGIPILSDAELATLQSAVYSWHHEKEISQALATRLAFFGCIETHTGTPLIGARDPIHSELLEFLETGPCRGVPFQMALVATRDLERVLTQTYRLKNDYGFSEDLVRLAEDAPVVELVNGVMARATDTRTSDVHIEPEEFGFFVRYRIDGRLNISEQYPKERFDAVVSRIKLISGLDIAERRLPQDGRFSIRSSGVETDVRVSIIPSVHGESVVLRLLPNTQTTRFDLEKLGMESDHLATYRKWMQNPDGIILVTGPTGSGKSTTLYATMVSLDTTHERVLTVEDPVEYQIPGVTQFQVHPEIGFAFPSVLRSLLRHDPDTIMVGEIRDAETARIAVQSSLTGHRIFSTLHTNDSATAFLRLVDMGVEPFLVAATVRGVIAQRLVRKLCPICAQEIRSKMAIPAQIVRDFEKLGLDPNLSHVMVPVGCDACGGTGYKGRTAVYELLGANDVLRAALDQPVPTHESILKSAEPGFRTLSEDALIKAFHGITSLEEVYVLSGKYAG